jgi:cold shock CspA family protein
MSKNKIFKVLKKGNETEYVFKQTTAGPKALNLKEI